MAIYKKDRERRILGDRILARQDEFADLHSIVQEIMVAFAKAHQDFSAALKLRDQEESEDQHTRRLRFEKQQEVATLYSWAYNQMEVLLAPSWDDTLKMPLKEDLREQLFPLGFPSKLDRTQLINDAMVHFIAAQGRQNYVQYPPAFIEKCILEMGLFQEAIARVTAEMGETEVASQQHIKARIQWDRMFRSLKHTTTGLLLFKNNESRLLKLFSKMPSYTGSNVA